MSNELLELHLRTPIFHRSIDRAVDRLMARSIARSLDRSIARSIARRTIVLYWVTIGHY